MSLSLERQIQAAQVFFIAEQARARAYESATLIYDLEDHPKLHKKHFYNIHRAMSAKDSGSYDKFSPIPKIAEFTIVSIWAFSLASGIKDNSICGPQYEKRNEALYQKFIKSSSYRQNARATSETYRFQVIRELAERSQGNFRKSRIESPPPLARNFSGLFKNVIQDDLFDKINSDPSL